MRVVKIVKTHTKGEVEHFLVLPDEQCGYEGVKDAVEKWCNSDPSGKIEGYIHRYNFVESKEKINEVLTRELGVLSGKLNSLQQEKDAVEEYLYSINNY